MRNETYILSKIKTSNNNNLSCSQVKEHSAMLHSETRSTYVYLIKITAFVIRVLFGLIVQP